MEPDQGGARPVRPLRSIALALAAALALARCSDEGRGLSPTAPIDQGSGGTVRRLATQSGLDLYAPDPARILSWSPDGSSLLYSAFIAPGPNTEVFVLDADGGTPQNLTSNPSDDWFPQWSPDGNRIVFTSNRNMPRLYWGWGDIFVMDADGSNLTQLTQSDARYRAPSFAPDGTAIAYVSDRSGVVSIYLADLAAPQQDLNLTSNTVHVADMDEANGHSGVRWQPR